MNIPGFRKEPVSTVSPLRDMLTPGKILSHYRQKRGYELEEISEATRIPIEHLQAIENDEYGDQDSQVFFRGFIRSYSDLLQLDTDKILAIYRRTLASQQSDVQETPMSTMDSDQPSLQSPLPIQQPQRKSTKAVMKNPFGNLHITPQLLATVFTGALILIVIVYIISQLSKFKQPPTLEVTSPENNSTVTIDSVEIRGKSDPRAIVEINEEKVSMNTKGEFSTTLKLTSGINTIVIKAYKNGKEDDATAVTRNITYTAPEPEPVVEEPGETEEPEMKETYTTEHEIKIKVVDEKVWLKLVTDDEQQMAYFVAPLVDDTYNFKFKKSMILTTGKPNQTTLYIDGKEIEIIPNPESGVARAECNIKNNEVVCQ